MRKLRISVTDRCNFRCQYCMPEEGLDWLERKEILSFEEIETLARQFVKLGIREIRLTGGEPLLRKDLPQLVAMLNNIPQLEKLSITSNGTLLPQLATPLYQAGLRHFNISLDSLQSERFQAITRRDQLQAVLKGIETLKGFPDIDIKVNTVIVRGFNEDEIMAFADLAYREKISVRFIEFMPLGADNNWSQQVVFSGQELIQVISQKYTLSEIEKAGANPAARWSLQDGKGELGFINSVSEPFCESCNRIRLTAEGRLRTCLFSHREYNLKKELRSGTSEEALQQTIQKAIWNKEAGHSIHSPQFEQPLRTMSQIGG